MGSVFADGRKCHTEIRRKIRTAKDAFKKAYQSIKKHEDFVRNKKST